MENVNQIFTLLAESEGIGLNLDILETGLINIIALVAILIYTGTDFLGSILQERQLTILKSIEDSENRLREANERLSEAQKQLSQAHFVLSNIRKETKLTKINLLKSDVKLVKKELNIRFNKVSATYRAKRKLLISTVKSEVLHIAFMDCIIAAKRNYALSGPANSEINKNIQLLEKFNELKV